MSDGSDIEDGAELAEEIKNGEREWYQMSERERNLVIRYGSTNTDPQLLERLELQEGIKEPMLYKFQRERIWREKEQRVLDEFAVMDPKHR